MKDILLYMSDQHSYRLQSNAGDRVVRTPMMDYLVKNGAVMTAAQTACPLCVPARAAMISGQLPSNNGVLFNFNSISSDKATFLHSLSASGYETVLCGRMHFVGPDQRHGYERRIAGDRTPVFHNNPPPRPGEERYIGFDENSSVYCIGAGNSPVLEYDKYVTQRALEYLSQDHDRPQFLTVGVYGPHFPYVASRELYDYYMDKVPLDGASDPGFEHPALAGKMRETDPQVVRAARAAYYALTETVDRNMSAVYEAFQAYLKRTGHEGVFIYVSDHGDMNGDRGYFGKQVFYDPSVHIPFIIQGDGIPAGVRVDSPVSLLDVGPTVCDLAGAEIIPGDGRSILPQIMGEDASDRMVVSEQYTYLASGGTSLGRMVRWRQWKFITYSGFEGEDMLFDLASDPGERKNVITDHPDIAERLRAETEKYRTYDQVMEHERWVVKQLRVLMKCPFEDEKEHWQCPPEVKMPEDRVSRKEPFKPTAWAPLMRKTINEAKW